VPCSFSRTGDRLDVWVGPEDEAEARLELEGAGLSYERAEEPERDWVAQAAALQRPVAVGPYLLDPHGAAAPSFVGRRRRLLIPASRAFGTGSHESTRLALRLLLREGLAGRRVLDAGCGAGVLGFVAACEGARVVAFDIDPDAAFKTRELAATNGVPGVSAIASPLASIGGPFDLAVANMIAEEVGPLLPGIRARLRTGGRLVTSGQLLSGEAEWLARLRASGFRPLRLAAENEWLAVTAEAV